MVTIESRVEINILFLVFVLIANKCYSKYLNNFIAKERLSRFLTKFERSLENKGIESLNKQNNNFF